MSSRLRLRALLAGALAALPLLCAAQELSRTNVAMTPLEATGEADPEYVETLSRQLMRAIEQNSDFRIVSGGSTRFHLRGRVFADAKRHAVSLELRETHTGRMLWLGNYDYRRVTVEAMAEEVIDELIIALRDDAWR